MRTLFILILILLADTLFGRLSVTSFGVRNNSTADNTTAFQHALDTAADRGEVVTVPAGQYRFNGTIIIPEGVTLEGECRSQHLACHNRGTVFQVYGGRDQEGSEPFITIKAGALLKGVTIFYPEQTIDNIRPYPWTIRSSGYRCGAVDITIVNAYNGIDFGTIRSTGHFLRNIHMCAVRRGLYIDRSADVGRVENVHIHNVNWWNVGEPYKPTSEQLRALKQYTLKNLEGFIIGRCDWEYMDNCFVIWMKTGFKFIETVFPEGVVPPRKTYQPNILITRSGADMSPVAVVVEKVQDHAGIAFENCQFMNGVHIQDTNTGPVKFSNCGFWGETDSGALKGSVITNDGTGEVMLQNCHFSRWEDPNRKYREWDPAAPLINIRNGSLLMSNCLFKDYGNPVNTHIRIHESALAAVVQSTIAKDGLLSIDNRARDRVIIKDNLREKTRSFYDSMPLLNTVFILIFGAVILFLLFLIYRLKRT